MDQWLTIKQVAAELGISVSAVYRLIARGSLASRLIVGKRVCARSAVSDLQQRETYIRQSRARREDSMIDQPTLEGVV